MLVVNPPGGLRSDMAAIEPPLWAGLIAAYHGADILDAEAEGLTLQQTVDNIHRWNGNRVLIVVMGNNPSVSSTPKMPVSEALAEKLGDKYHVFLTGIHPLAAGSKFPVMRINTSFPQGTGFPDMPWHKLPMHRYRAHNWHCLGGLPRSPYAVTYTSLGCPYHCHYCNIHALYGGSHKVEFRPVEAVIREVHMLASRYGVRNLKIWDELFTLREDRVLAICDGIKGLGLNAWCYGRLDSVNPKMLRAMKDAGINWIAYGFESLGDLKWSRLDVKWIIDMTRDAGIAIIANFMMGMYDHEVDRATMDFAKINRFEWANFYTALPYPGSPWWEELGKPTDIEWDQYRRSDRRQWFYEYFSNPVYQDAISKRFGPLAGEEVRQMLKEDILIKEKNDRMVPC